MMNPMRDLPMGFGMALLQNEKSAQFFESCSDAQKQQIIKQTDLISSKKEMQAFVDNLPSAAL